jgi:hypothetical protein
MLQEFEAVLIPDGEWETSNYLGQTYAEVHEYTKTSHFASVGVLNTSTTVNSYCSKLHTMPPMQPVLFRVVGGS